MGKLTPEDVLVALTPEVRTAGGKEFDESDSISWITKQNGAEREIYIATYWLREKFLADGIDGNEIGFRLWDAGQKMRQVGPYVAAAEAWNRYLDGEASPSMEAHEKFSRRHAAMATEGRAVN